jgi:hypothetical protein
MMNKVFGERELYAPIRKDGNRTIICYEYKEEPDGKNATWYEIYDLPKGTIGLQTIKDLIIKDINSQIDE